MQPDPKFPRPKSLLKRTTPGPILRDTFTAISHVILTPKRTKIHQIDDTLSFLRRNELVWKVPTPAETSKHVHTFRSDLQTHESSLLEKETKKSCNPDKLYKEYVVKELKERLKRTFCWYMMERNKQSGSPVTNTLVAPTSPQIGFSSRKPRSQTVKSTLKLSPFHVSKPAARHTDFALLSMQKIHKEMKSLRQLRDQRYQKAIDNAVRAYNLQEFEDDEPRFGNKTLNAFSEEFK